jgi:hypothetical protein
MALAGIYLPSTVRFSRVDHIRTGRCADNYILCSDLGVPKQTTRIKREKTSLPNYFDASAHLSIAESQNRVSPKRGC